jgi:hypothetical protein
MPSVPALTGAEAIVDDELFEIEKGFWLSGEEHFRKHLDEECLLAFPQQGEMHGLFSRDQVAASVAMPDRWRDLAMSDRYAKPLSDNATVISYRAIVRRSDGTPYEALVSSVYVRREQGWRLAFHQHSPDKPEG